MPRVRPRHYAQRAACARCPVAARVGVRCQVEHMGAPRLFLAVIGWQWPCWQPEGGPPSSPARNATEAGERSASTLPPALVPNRTGSSARNLRDRKKPGPSLAPRGASPGVDAVPQRPSDTRSTHRSVHSRIPHREPDSPGTSPGMVRSPCASLPNKVTMHMENGADSVAAYYGRLTGAMLRANGDFLACHFGLWGPETTSPDQALLRSNRTLVQGCPLRPGQHVLDAGSGVGGTSIWLARTYGVRVTGLTICEPHVAAATEQAERQGVGHLVQFRYGDYMEPPFPDDTFDLVVNHESLCHAADKLGYLRATYRVLKPGGRWQALEGLLRSGKPMLPWQDEIHAGVQYGFCTAPLSSWRAMLRDAERAGFETAWQTELDSEVAPFIAYMQKYWALELFLLPTATRGKTYNRLMRAVGTFGEGLHRGVLTYRFMSATKPGDHPKGRAGARDTRT